MGARLPGLIGAIASFAGWRLGLALTRSDREMWNHGGYSTGPEYTFVVFCAIVAGLVAYYASRRLVSGPKLNRESWALYRERGPLAVTLEALRAPLRERGYDVTLSPLPGERTAGMDHALLRHASVRHGGVAIDLRDLVESGVGTIEASDARGDLYAELAKYALYELGRLVPGITYRGGFSALTPESTDTLEPQLPDRPHHLPR